MMVNLSKSDKRISSQAYDIIILAGQSNAVGYGKGSIRFEPGEKVDVIYKNAEGRRFGKAIWNKNKFYFHNADKRLSQFTGFYLFFGEEYEKELLKEGRKLLFLRSAVGGTGFTDNRWGLNDDLYTDAVKTAGRLLSLNPQNRLAGILWHQGETDVLGGSSYEYYYDKLKSLIEGFRRELNMPHLPFIAGDMVEEWAAGQPNYINIRNATLKVIESTPGCGFVSSSGLKGNDGDDCIHFSNAANAQLGKRYFEEYKKVIADGENQL